MRHHMCPDEAFGMVFNLDNVIANTKTRQQAAWHRLAKLEGLPPPKPDRPLFDLRPERVITEASIILYVFQFPLFIPIIHETERFLFDLRPERVITEASVMILFPCCGLFQLVMSSFSVF